VLSSAIYNVMPKRQVQLLQSTTSRLGPVPVSRIEQVRKDIMGTVRQLVEDGEIQVQLFAEQTVE
jgi:flagellar motor switch protein FliG